MFGKGFWKKKKKGNLGKAFDGLPWDRYWHFWKMFRWSWQEFWWFWQRFRFTNKKINDQFLLTFLSFVQLFFFSSKVFFFSSKIIFLYNTDLSIFQVFFIILKQDKNFLYNYNRLYTIDICFCRFINIVAITNMINSPFF